MKKSFLMLCLMLTSGLYAQSGWQYSEVPTYALSFHFTDSNYGLMGGQGQNIYRSTNGGANWSVFHTYTQQNFQLNCIYLMGRQKVFAGFRYDSLGTRGELWKSLDSGHTYSVVFRNEAVESIDFPSENTGYIGTNTRLQINTSGKIHKTTNGGNTWVQQFSDAYIFKDIDMVNDNTGWALGYRQTSNNKSTVVYKTTNGGQVWSIVKNEASVTVQPEACGIEAINENTAYYYDSDLYKTTDGGSSWENKTTSIPSTGGSFCAEFINEQTGWYGGDFNGSVSTIYRTTNSGLNWTAQPLQYFDLIRKIQFVDPDKGFILAGDYAFYRTSSGGEPVGVQQISGEIPERFLLEQNYPNPFNPITRINYELKITNYVSLNVYDAEGKLIEALVSGKQNAGSYSVTFDGSALSSGVYYYTLEAGEFKETRKMLLIK